MTISIPVLQNRTLLRLALMAAAILLAFWMDGLVADLFAKPIRSGQVRATLTNLRCWGEGPTLVMVAVGLSFAVPKKFKLAATALGLALLCAAVVEGVKPVFGRKRPDEAKVNPDQGTWQFRSGRNSSFPSGHTATAFAFGRGLTAIVPNLRPICILAATGTAVSRMHDQRHYLSDCVVGAILGWGMTGFLWRRLPFLEGLIANFLPWKPAFYRPAETEAVSPSRRAA